MISVFNMIAVEKGGPAVYISAKLMDSGKYLVRRYLSNGGWARPELWAMDRLEKCQFYVSQAT